MKNSGLVLRLALLVVLLATVHLAVDLCGGGAKPRAHVLSLLDPTLEIDALELERRDAAPIRLERDIDWRLTSPVAGAADRRAVMRLADALSSVPVGDVFSDQELLKLGRTRSDFLLEEPRLKIRVFAGGVRRTISFGGPTPSGEEVYAAVEGTAAVCAVPGEVFSAVDVTLDDLRRKALFRLDPTAVNAFALRDGQGRHRVFRRDAEGWKSEGETAAAESVAELLGALAGAEALSFVWPRGVSNEQASVSAAMLASYGIDPESSPLAVLGEGDVASERIAFGKSAADADAVYALIGNGSAVVTVPQTVGALVSGDFTRYFDRRLFPIDAARVKSIVLTEGNRTCALALDPKLGWSIESPVIAPADGRLVGELVGRLVSLTRDEAVVGDLTVSLSTNAEPVAVSRDLLLGKTRFEDFRSREILRFDPAQLRRIVRTPAGGAPVTLVCSRETRLWRAGGSEAKAVVDENRLGRLLSELNPLRALRIEKLKVSANELTGYGLEKPWMVLAVDPDQAGVLRRNLLIGEKTAGGRYATVGSSEAVFVLSDATLEALSLPLFE